MAVVAYMVNVLLFINLYVDCEATNTPINQIFNLKLEIMDDVTKQFVQYEVIEV